ncbi:MAG: type II 3-dehydroquinate dehydratase [Pseudomonadota bacterium]|nr:type II 3-dehydroquinate dehydratase [Pseudomonadota bacterium]MEE3280116.1 type II 3-dehydroquinate dehydratase [Pseudomonadota bacterium]
MRHILLLHGPNLNLLGTREPSHYGHQTLADINRLASQTAAGKGFQLASFQSNAENALIERVHAAATDGTEFIVINPAGFTHTSVALRDALAGVAIPFIEVHLSNVHARESFRRHSYFSDLALGVIAGFGAMSYELALEAAIAHLESGH